MEPKELEATPNEPQSAYQIRAFKGPIGTHKNGFVMANWLNSLRSGNEYFKLINKGAYYQNYAAYLERLLLRPTNTLRLALLAEDPDVMLGFSVSDGAVLHYVYVKPDVRRQGIGTSLVKDFNTFTHITKTAMKLWNSHFPRAFFDPFR